MIQRKEQRTESREPRFVGAGFKPDPTWFLLFIVALLPRVLDLGRFVTHDEAEFWLDRSRIFLRAIEHGDYAATAITTHPGVTTMWLGSAGIVLRQALFAWGWLQRDTFPVMLTLMRLPVVLVHVAAILLGYALLRRMLPARVAFLAALFWATDPFVIGYSRLLHVDALMGTFATVSLLSACSYWHHHRHSALLILSAVCAGLAVLSKSPGLALLPAIGFIALMHDASWITHHESRIMAGQVSKLPLQISLLCARFSVLALWLAVFVLTLLIVWPAIWASPLRVYELLRIGVENEGAQPHMTGNFFLGERQEAPGLLYYPVAVALRLTPWTLLGLFLVASPPSVLTALRRRPLSSSRHRDMAALALFCILFIIALSLFAKKFNRYLVPIFPVLDILAAAGLGYTMHHVHHTTPGKIVNRAFLPILTGIAIVNAAWWHPYSMVAFNQALGGAQAGAHTFAVGWGEGFDLAADWLNQQPDITGVLVQSRMIKSLNPYLRKGAQAFFPDEGKLRKNAGYVVVYISEVQGGPPLAPFDQFYGQAIPLHTVTIHGVPYAWIYQVPTAVPQPRSASFAHGIHLRGFGQDSKLQPGQPCVFSLFWSVSGALSTDYWLFAHLSGPDGQRYAQVDLPYATSQWQPGRYFTTELPLTLPASMPPGTYRLVIGLYDPASGQRLPLESRYRANLAIDGEHALLLTEEGIAAGTE